MGYVQADAANLYESLFRDKVAVDKTTATEVGCWAMHGNHELPLLQVPAAEHV